MAARQFYADLPRPLDARVACEAGDEAREVLCDELAEGFRGRGLSAASAAGCAEVAMKILAGRDRGVCGLAVAEVAEEERVAIAARVCETAEVVSVERLRAACSRMWDWPDARKGLGAMFFAMGWPLHGCASMRALAKMRAVSVEDVSNVVDELQRLLGRPRNGFQKSEAEVAKYKQTNGATK